MLRATLVTVVLASKGMTSLLQQAIGGLSTVRQVANEAASTTATEAANNGARDDRAAQSLSLYLSRTR